MRAGKRGICPTLRRNSLLGQNQPEKKKEALDETKSHRPRQGKRHYGESTEEREGQRSY